MGRGRRGGRGGRGGGRRRRRAWRSERGPPAGTRSGRRPPWGVGGGRRRRPYPLLPQARPFFSSLPARLFNGSLSRRLGFHGFHSRRWRLPLGGMHAQIFDKKKTHKNLRAFFFKKENFVFYVNGVSHIVCWVFYPIFIIFFHVFCVYFRLSTLVWIKITH